MKILVAILSIGLCAGNGYAFGPRAHILVGTIADRRLDSNKVIKTRVSGLLDGMTLAKVSTFPDLIKAWDPANGLPVSSPVSDSRRIDEELRAFVRANSAPNRPSHNEFHYTMVSVLGNEKYSSSKVGRSESDIVHLISYCIGVLRGGISVENDRKITKTVAVILLTHLLADIHQPLHVGALYFDINGALVQPTSETSVWYDDQSGNRLTLFLSRRQLSAGRLHGYWDTQSVENAFGVDLDSTIAARLAAKQPENWRLTSRMETWGEQLADDVLPLAREAYSRLDYKNIKIYPGQRTIASGSAVEKPPVEGGDYYSIWAANVVKQQIHKAGWRLADVLEEALK
ncbi:MAG TPA: S1/P1 nuclease [Candidatus Saccharimonadales bacterium]|nr:S1/P1 nuclease [Candidatus Saccharimonadales bacterium]